MQVRNTQKLQTSHSAFSSLFQGQKLEKKNTDKEKGDSKEKNIKLCLCGKLY